MLPADKYTTVPVTSLNSNIDSLKLSVPKGFTAVIGRLNVTLPLVVPLVPCVTVNVFAVGAVTTTKAPSTAVPEVKSK